MPPARALSEAVATLPIVGPIFQLALLPAWCADSLARDAMRTGRSIASIARWAFLWPMALVVVLVTLTTVSVAAGWLGSVLVLWLVAPVGVGAIVASRARDLGGFGVGAAGLLASGVVLGLVAWLIAVVTWLFGSTSVVGPIEALIVIPVFSFTVPVLTAAQFGVGVVVVSVVSWLRPQSRGQSDPAAGAVGVHPDRLDGEVGAGTTPPIPPVAGSLAEEAAAAQAASRARRLAQDGHRARWASGARGWALLVGGVLFGLFVTFAGYVPAGEPDAAEVTFALSLFTIVGGLGLGRWLFGGPLAPAAVGFLGLGIGAAIGFVLVFFTPLLGA